MITNRYDIHYLFENGYDQAPKIFATELYQDKFGYWNTNSDISDRYDFTPEDEAWLIANVKQTDGTPYTDISDFSADNYFDQDDPDFIAMLPPMAAQWLEQLPEYNAEEEK